MQFINGISLIWDEEADRKLLGGLFQQQANAPVLEPLETDADHQLPVYRSPFGSGSLFNQAEDPCPCEGNTIDSGINFNALAAAIDNRSLFGEKFNYRKYLFNPPFIVGQEEPTIVPNLPKPNNGLSVTDEKGNTQIISYEGWINTEQCFVNSIPEFSILTGFVA